MGKTTSLRTIMGLTRAWDGKSNSRAAPSPMRAPTRSAGMALAMSGRPRHLPEPDGARKSHHVGATGPLDAGARLRAVSASKRAPTNWGHQLSGGEQQMLSIGRALMLNPSLMLLDEATEGLAPLVQQEIWNCLRVIAADGISILVVDKNIKALLPLAQRHYIIQKGEICWTGTSTDCRQPRFARSLHHACDGRHAGS